MKPSPRRFLSFAAQKILIDGLKNPKESYIIKQ